MKSLLGKLVILVILLTGCISVEEPSYESEDVTIRIDLEEEKQLMRHFGASAAWWAQAVGKWPEPVVDEMMDLLFDKKSGIGLDIIRYNIGGGKDGVIVNDQLRRVETLEVSPGVYDWRRDENSIKIIDKAVERGAEVLLFFNSPPLRLTKSGATTGSGRASNLKEGMEQEYAEYVVGVSEYLKKEKGWPIKDISPINEPNNSWAPANGQEGCSYSPDQAYRVIKAVHTELKRLGSDLKISTVDTGEMMLGTNAGYIKTIFGDEELNKSLDHYAVHSYWSTRFDREDLKKYMDKNFPGKEIWMTEWTEMVHGKDLSMDAGRVLAQTVFEDIVFGGVSSWQYWIALSPYDYKDGLIYIDMVSRDYEAAKKLWVLGNWSKFIQKDAVRIETQVEGGNVFISTFKNPDNSLVVVVYNSDLDYGKTLNIDGIGEGYVLTGLYETSEYRDLEDVLHKYTGVVPPNSVSTLIFR